MVCKQCGSEVVSGENFCNNCGAAILDSETEEYIYSKMEEKENKTQTSTIDEISGEAKVPGHVLATIAKVFMIIACVTKAFYIIPLFWTIPMTVILSKKLKNKKPIGFGFKICTLIFVNLIAGILLFCVTNDEVYEN